MIRNIGNTYTRVVVSLDGQHFEKCTFDHCTLQFSGTANVGLVDCTFTNCNWSFVGPAVTTLDFLSALYNGLGPSGKQLVEDTFENIRSGQMPRVSTRG